MVKEVEFNELKSITKVSSTTFLMKWGEFSIEKKIPQKEGC
jgi:hypothetical protein